MLLSWIRRCSLERWEKGEVLMRVVAPTWKNNRYYVIRTKYNIVKPTNLKAGVIWLWIYKSFVHRVGHFQFYLSMAVYLSSQELESTLPCWICLGLMASFDQQEEESAAWYQLSGNTTASFFCHCGEAQECNPCLTKPQCSKKPSKGLWCCIAYTKAFLTFQAISDAV